MTVSDVPRVGVGVFILNDKNEFVFGKRKGSHGAGTWALPGGHLEYGESFEECSKREIMEETGMEIENVQFLTAVNSVLTDEGKHYVTIFMVCRPAKGSGPPQLLEPNKCEGWEWISWENMMEWYQKQQQTAKIDNQLFLPMMSLVDQRPDLRPSIS